MNRDELDALATISPLRTWSSILADYGVLLAAAGLVVVVPHPTAIAAAAVLIGRQQHALTILIHEGVHYRLFRSRKLNDFVCRWLLAGPLLLSYEGYRRAHLDHHRYTMTPDDPDFRFVSGFPVSRSRFLAGLLPDFLGITYSFLVLHYARRALAATASARKLFADVLPGVALNVAALAVMTAAGRGAIFLACWVVPMFCLLPFLLHLRGICEHGGQRADPDPMRCTWTVINRVETFFLAPHHIHYHMEHHGYPAIPHFNLPRLHASLRRQGVLPLQNVRTSYRSILAELVRE